MPCQLLWHLSPILLPMPLLLLLLLLFLPKRHHLEALLLCCCILAIITSTFSFHADAAISS
jgi:hypothetical protein